MAKQTLDEFGKYWLKHPNSCDFDGNYGAQCVDLFQYYLQDVIGINPIFGFNYAYEIWDDSVSNYLIKNGAKKVAYNNNLDKITEGSILVWAKERNGYAGHVAILYKGKILECNYQPHTVTNSNQLNSFTKALLGWFDFGGKVSNLSGGTTFDPSVNKTAITVTYNKMTGYGEIKKDWTELQWFGENSTTPTFWGFYGFAKEKVDFIGRIGKSHYYCKVHGLCQSWIKCVVPVNMVKNINGKVLSTKDKILVGYRGSSSTASETGKFKGKGYNLTKNQIRNLCAICWREQGSLKGAKAEASLMCNLYEEKGGGYSNLYNYVLKDGWFNSESYNLDTIRNADQKQIDSIYDDIYDVIAKGNRTLPLYINEHDWINDITYMSTSDWIKNQTVVENKFGSTWIFYCFPTQGSDPFGYTRAYYKKVTGKNPPV